MDALNIDAIETTSRPPLPRRRSHTVETIPTELLQHIAYFVATPELKGPPSDLVHLCCTSKSIHASLCLSNNPSLYASIFRFKFDFAAPARRLGPEYLNASSLATELCNRFEGMKRIRAGVGSRPCDSKHREHDLWMAIFLMLENDGKNAVQLKQFAFVEQWLLDFFLDHSGGSYASDDIYSKVWPRDNEDNKLAMWLLWLCDADRTSLNYSFTIRRMYCEILRAYAIGASKYPLTLYSWTDFIRRSTSVAPSRIVYVHYGFPLAPTAPPISISAILGYMTRIKEPERLSFSLVQDTAHSSAEVQSATVGFPPCLGGPSAQMSISGCWDCDWEQCVVSDLDDGDTNRLDRFYRPGTLEGAWEGLFTYTEFGVYAAILSGGPPQTLHDGAIGQNLQMLKLREYNLYSSSSDTSDSPQSPLPPGDVLDAFFPPALIEERHDHVVFSHASQQTTYMRYSRPVFHEEGAVAIGRRKLCDVVVLGEGHSSWGDFELRGRVRASDAFVTILKRYYGAESRAKWIYRGYLVGGRLVGRWRDALTPLRLDGYEGAFELSRRA